MAAPPKVTIEDFLDNLADNPQKKAKVSKAEILNIITVCENDAKRKANLEVSHRKRIFFELCLKQMDSFTGAELLRVWDFLNTIKYDENRIFHPWEDAMTKKLDPDLTFPVLKIYHSLGRRMSDQMFTNWCREAGKSARIWNGEQLVFAVQTLRKMKQQPHSEFTQKWAAAVGKMDHQFTSSFNKTLSLSSSYDRTSDPEMLQIIRCCGKLWMRDPEVEDFVVKFLSNNKTNEIGKMSGKELVRLMQGVGALKVDPSRAEGGFVASWVQLIMKEMKNMDGKTLARAGWALSRCRVTPKDKTFTEEWAKNIQSEILNFGPKELGMTIEAMMHFWLSAAKHQKLHLQWMQVAQPKLKQFWSQALASMIFNFTRLGTVPKEDFVRSWLSACHENLSGLYMRDLVYIMEGLATVGTAPQQAFVDDWMEESRDRVTNISPQAAQYLIEAMDKLQINMPAEIKKRVERAADKMNKNERPKSTKSKAGGRPNSKTRPSSKQNA